MANSSLTILEIDLDSKDQVWAVGQDLRKFNGTSWDYYNYQNSAVPSVAPFYLDTRSISIGPGDLVWCGCAQAPVGGTGESAVFFVNGSDVTLGKSWSFSQLGNFSLPVEVSKIFACPFGNDVLAFVTPLNGNGGTAGSTSGGATPAATGGYLFRYDISLDVWTELSPGYTWPHVYDIQARGFNGNSYKYYLGTSSGLLELPGEELPTASLQDGTLYVPSVKFVNSGNSNLPTDNIYSLDIDENQNLWMGGDSNLYFYDFDEIQIFPIGLSGPFNAVQARENGHVFYGSGWGVTQGGTGAYHFNGYNNVVAASVANGFLPNNSVIDIKVSKENRNYTPNLTSYKNDLWILTYNNLTKFTYEIPHIYASSKYTGATGWNFIDYQPGITSSIPFANRYSWTYPDWQIYSTEYLTYKHPGLDPRNLFLTTSLEEIANGAAGTEAYWNDSPIPSYNQTQFQAGITAPDWASILINDNLSDFSINTVCSTGSGRDKKYLIGGYVTGVAGTKLVLGKYSSGATAFIEPQNPSSYANTNSNQGGSTYDAGTPAPTSKTGFVSVYDFSGVVLQSLVIPGGSTEVFKMITGENGEIFIFGVYSNLIEAGNTIWSSVYGYPTGATSGLPAGLTYSGFQGSTSGYPWIYSATGATGATSGMIGYSASLDISPLGATGFLIRNDYDLTSSSTNYTGNQPAMFIFGGTTSTGSLDLNNAYSGYTLGVTGSGLTPSYFRVNAIVNDSPSAGNFTLKVNSLSSSGNFATGGTYYFNLYKSSNLTFPYINSGISSSANPYSDRESMFIMKLSSNIGEYISKSSVFEVLSTPSNLGFAWNNYGQEWVYQVTDFRPFQSGNGCSTGSIKITDADISKNLISFVINNTASSSPIYTLKNLNGRIDSPNVPETIVADGGSYTFQSSLVLMDYNLNFKGVYNINSDTSVANNSFNYFSTRILSDSNKVAFSGLGATGFFVGGTGIFRDNSSNPALNGKNRSFYSIVDFSNPDQPGVTGSFCMTPYGASGPYFNSFCGSLAKDEANQNFVFTNLVLGDSEYFGYTSPTPYTGSGSLKGYFGTAVIKPGNSIERVVFGNYSNSFSQNNHLQKNSFVNNLGQLVLICDDPNTQSTNVFKQDLNDGKTYSFDLEIYLNTVDSLRYFLDENSDVLTFGENGSAMAGPDFLNNVSLGGSVLFRIKQYNPSVGINLGEIISRPGSDPWIWCDVHQSDSGMTVPLLSTVFISNYNSGLYGKQNNTWILSDATNGREILNVKSVPYFIYTFTEPGYFSIYNSVEDAFGNVYEATKPAFITVVNHKEVRLDDPNSEIVNSIDYGQTKPPTGEEEQIDALRREMGELEAKILIDSRVPFSSGIVIKNNPDATYNS